MSEWAKEQEVKKKLDVSCWTEIDSGEKLREYMKLAPDLDKHIHNHIISQIPNCVTLVKELVQTTARAAELKSKVSGDSIDALKALIPAVEALVQGGNEGAGDLILEIARLINEIDRRQEHFLYKALGVAGTSVVVVVGFLLTVVLGRNKNDSAY